MFLLRLLVLVVLGWLLLLLISFATIIESYCANLCSVLWLLLVFILIRYMGLEFSMFYSVCVFGCLRMYEALDCLSYNTVLLCCHNVCMLLS